MLPSGQCLPTTTGQLLAAALPALCKLRAAKQERVVDPPLFAAGGCALVFAPLVVTQAGQGLTLPPRFDEQFLLFVPQFLQTQQFALQLLALLFEGQSTQRGKAQLGGRGSGGELSRLSSVEFLHSRVMLVENAPHLRHLLVGGAQTQFLLVLQTLPEVKNRLQRKTEGHD
jgi:hypothetical protein